MQAHNNLLVVEDDPKLREELLALLGNNGYQPCALRRLTTWWGRCLPPGRTWCFWT